jgi:hypothetical protein
MLCHLRRSLYVVVCSSSATPDATTDAQLAALCYIARLDTNRLAHHT